MLAKWKRDNKSIGKVRAEECQTSLSSGLVLNFFSAFQGWFEWPTGILSLSPSASLLEVFIS